VQDETLADSSLLNKAPSKGGGEKEQRERTQVEARSTEAKVGHHRAKEQINVGFVLGKSWEILLGEEEDKRMRSPGIGNLTLNLDCLSSFENSIQDSHLPTNHLHSPFTFGILPSGRCIQISAADSGTNTIPAI